MIVGVSPRKKRDRGKYRHWRKRRLERMRKRDDEKEEEARVKSDTKPY